jgi:hypothetical protein
VRVLATRGFAHFVSLLTVRICRIRVNLRLIVLLLFEVMGRFPVMMCASFVL